MDTLRRDRPAACSTDAYPAIRVYLVAYAYLVLGLRDVGAVKNFILNDRARRGSSSLDYASVGAARELVADKGYNIPTSTTTRASFVDDRSGRR